MYVKVMTDEQYETLRKQIAIYGTICERLVEMHKTLTAQQDLAGFFLLLLYHLVSLFTSRKKKGLFCKLCWASLILVILLLFREWEIENSLPFKKTIIYWHYQQFKSDTKTNPFCGFLNQEKVT